MKKLIILLLTIVNVQIALSQVVKLTPDKPSWNDELQISYDSNDSNAVLKGNEAIYARIEMHFQNGDNQKISLKLKNNKGKNINSFKIPNSTSFVSIEFHTLSLEDNKSTLSTKIYQDDKPVKNAYIDELPYYRPNQDSLFQLEIQNYPKNVQAYGTYFIKILPPPYSDDLGKALAKYMPVLEKEYKKKKNRKNNDLLFSLCISYIKSKKFDKAKEFLVKLLKLYPKSPLTNLAFSYYSYDSFKAGNLTPIDNELKNELIAVCKTNPESLICSEKFYYRKKDTTLNVGLFEKSLLFAIARDSLNYDKKIELAEIYFDNQLFDKAENLIRKTISFILKGGMRYSWSAENSYVQEELARAYKILAEIQQTKGNYINALASINSAINLISDNQHKTAYISVFKEIKAKIYMDLSNFNLAEEEYTILYMQDDTAAKEKLLKIYKTKYNVTAGFVDYLANLEKKYAFKAKYKKAPKIDVTDINGNKYTSKKLMGKVVVLNFWSTGCGGCVGEIPELNKLVDKYANNNEVVFLAISNSDSISLDKFLSKRPFKYKIVNNAPGLDRKFNVTGSPHHFILNKNSEIIMHITGGRANIVDILSRKIDEALNE